VKWALVERVPADPRLLPGMFFVVEQGWDWQAKAARVWLSQFAGTAAFEQARIAEGVAVSLEPPHQDDDDETN
jgi:hypothetical protein